MIKIKGKCRTKIKIKDNLNTKTKIKDKFRTDIKIKDKLRTKENQEGPGQIVKGTVSVMFK